MSSKKEKESKSNENLTLKERKYKAVQKCREKKQQKDKATAKRVEELTIANAILEGQTKEMKNSKRRLKEQILKKYENKLDQLTEEQRTMLIQSDSSDDEEL